MGKGCADDAGDLGRGGFVVHATVYVATNLFLFVIWGVTGAGFPWFVFPLLGWGIGLAAHGAAYRARVDAHWEAVARQQAGLPG
jgi:2TM domain-containing protein